MLGNALPNFLWNKVGATVNSLINRSPTCANNGCIPYQLLWCSRRNVHSVRIIDSMVYVKVIEHFKSKLDPCTLQCVLVACDSNTKKYRCYYPPSRHILVSSNVKINKKHLYYKHPSPSTSRVSPPIVMIFLDSISSDPPSSLPSTHLSPPPTVSLILLLSSSTTFSSPPDTPLLCI